MKILKIIIVFVDYSKIILPIFHYKLKYDSAKMKKDIDKYGFFKYEDVSKYMRKEVFDQLPICYLRISIKKGITTKKRIVAIFEKYLNDK